MSSLFTIIWHAIIAFSIIISGFISLTFFLAAAVAAFWLPIRLLLDLIQLVTKSRRNSNWQIAAAIMGMCCLFGILWDFSGVSAHTATGASLSAITVGLFWLLVIYGCAVLPSEICVVVHKQTKFNKIFSTVRVVFAMPLIFVAMMAVRFIT